MMSEDYSFKLAANRWVIKARWFYLLAVTAVCLLLKWKTVVALDWTAPANIFASPLFSLLALALAANALLFVVARMISLETAHKHTGWLSFLQITFEIVLITLLLFDLPGGELVVPLLYFLPIVEAIVLFGHYGPLVVAILIGLITGAALFLPAAGPLGLFLDGAPARSKDLPTEAVFTWTLILAIVYLVIGLVSSFIARQVRCREEVLVEEVVEQTAQLSALENVNRELAGEERSLKAKDYELAMANQHLQSLEEAKSKFVAVTAHQLRTPLSAIKWTFDMIMRGQLGPVTAEQNEFLAKGFDSTQRMIRIVNDLLHVDHMEAGKIEYNFAPVALDTLLDQVIFEFANQATSKKIELTFAKTEKPLPAVAADENKLRVVLENLLDNALKYTAVGGKVAVAVSDRKINSAGLQIEITITDSGIGIPAEDKSKIFGKFFRAENAIRQEPDGSGLGLYMSKDIVEKHGGTLSYESAPAGGTIFRLVLPLKQAK